ncbi:hypothetical protein [Pseudanabaena yagii]|uniref:Uncharacterized protein n=1 Tax=Pseudanabaena yagii GIHE-NHR1 TaxID=2722753 RepID=A0ABX1M1S3_9CYAN|nr:hypothetical protein [Pseudanabaena yagii]NMF60989.1 hypothetical protein [Pseudanabaena yagii GIHE-NHR1]
MASRTLVKNYLAQWMQMGKTVSLSTQNKPVHIHKILQGERYSTPFNNLWSEISTNKAQEAYLSGTSQTISDLLSNQWEIIACARCNLLVPTLGVGPRTPVCCPCDDLPNHPNLDLVSPHVPVKLATHMDALCDRLAQNSTDQEDQESNVIPPNATYSSEEEDAQTIHNLRDSVLKLVKSSVEI